MIRRITLFFGIIFFYNTFFIQNINAISLDLKIPFPKNESWLVTQGYDGDGWGSGKPTHNSSSKDRFAIDFSLPGESDYNKQVLAVANGIISIKESKVIDKITGDIKYTGYGKYIDIDHGNGIISRYAHLLSFSVEDGEMVKQGQLIGYLDSTGYSSGSHLHFAMYQKDAKGNLQPYKPEPMSGYTNFQAGEWYVSDNELYDPNKKVEQVVEQPQEQTKSWWNKVKDFFNFNKDNINSENSQELKDNTQNTEIKIDYENKQVETKTYSLTFINSNQTVEVKPGEELKIEVKVKNIGTAIWKKGNISANVVGGLTKNSEYHHQTWLTSLRPALLDQTQLTPGQIGSFSFIINTPNKVGNYLFKIQAVRLDNNFSFIPEEFWNININVVNNEQKEIYVETPVISEKEEIVSEKKENFLKNNIVKDTVEIIKEVVGKAVDTVKEFFYYSGGGGSSQPIIEDSSNNSTLDNVTTTTMEISTTTPEVVEDNIPPEIPVVYLNQSGSTTLCINWNSPDASNYDIEYKTEQDDWQTIALKTTSTEHQFEGEKLQSYYFRVRAYDEVGNVSDWSNEEKLILDWSKSVVINEIAWMGTSPGRDGVIDEWIELYNNTDNDIDLSNWQILIDDKSLQISRIINPIIPAKGYFILERTDDKTILDIDADMLFIKEINDDKGKITLKNNFGEIIDEVDCSDGWFAGSILNKQYRSMMRIDSTLPGSWSSNWQTTLGVDPVARVNGGGNIFGSPKHSNQGSWSLANLKVYYLEQFDENNVLVLKIENSPYIFDSIEIPVGYTLKIDPGVVLYGKSRDSYIKVKGNLEINGEEDNPVVFTSALDNNYVKNNFSYLKGSPQPSNWSRIEIEPGGNLIAKHAKFFYGGTKFFIPGGFVFGGKFVSRVISNLGGIVELDNVEFKNNYIDTDPNYLMYSAVVWSEAQAGNNVSTTVVNSYFENGSVAIKDMNNVNYYRVYQKVHNNVFSNFTSEKGAIQFGDSRVDVSSNTFLNGTNNILSRIGWTLEKDEVLSNDMEYHFNSLYIPKGTTLFINPGVKIKMNGSSITVRGSLEAMGTPDEPISISNQKGYNWGFLKFINSTSSLNYVQISRGGLLHLEQISMVEAENSNLSFDHVNLFNPANDNHILHLKNSNIFMSKGNLYRSVFTSNSKGIKAEGGLLVLDNVNFNGFGYAIKIYKEGSLVLKNMNEDNFQNILSFKWWPQTAWSFASST